MKKQLGVSSFLYIHGIILLLLCSIHQSAIGQFQTTIGFPYPTSENSPGGIVLPGGGFALPAENFEHPNSIFGPLNSDWQIVRLNATGNLLSPSKWIGRPSVEGVAWMELSTCKGQNNFIIAGSDDGDMTLAMTSTTGVPDPTFIKIAGTTTDVETSACVKEDGSGNFVVVGTQQNVSGLQGVVILKVDCTGALSWSRVYYINGWTTEASSVTAFSTFIGICPQPGTNNYYITGKMTPFAGGDSRVFLLSVDASNGGYNFMNAYDINPAADDAGTCIQANCDSNPLGEIWISGYSYESAANAQTVMMLKTDINGIPIWANNYDIANGDEFAKHFTFGPNGKLIVAGKAEESTIFQGTKDGDCMLMSIDGSGNTVDWTRKYINTGFSSQGNRVEPAPNGDYFVSGHSLEFLSPNQSARNILAILTDNVGQTNDSCFTSPVTTVISRPPMYSTFAPPALTLGSIDFYNNSGLDDLDYTDQQMFCPTDSLCICDFTYTTSNCFQVDFTATCMPPGAYSYEWTINCNSPVYTTTTPNFSYTFPCGGGQYTVCLDVYQNGVLCSSISHLITVPSTCCGPILDVAVACTANNNIYKFVIEVGNAPGAASCLQPIISITPTIASLSNLIYTPLPTSWIISGNAQVVTSKTSNLLFTIQSNCLCPVTGLPMTCSQMVNIQLPCCKLIQVDDLEICHDLDVFHVPIVVNNWAPLMMINQVSWYVLPKPPGGCPPVPWGSFPYQSNVTTSLEPLHIYPSSLPEDEYCIYSVVHLDDGPCKELTSNAATLQLCQPNSCLLNDSAYCYNGTPIVPGQLTLTINSPAKACPISSIEWFDPQGNLVQTGGTTFTPVQSIGMQNDQLCYQDTFYTVKLTDLCGVHTCKARIRLYSGLAAIGTLAMAPPEPPFLCATNKDATIKFTPECAGDPPNWVWYQQDCKNGPVVQLYDAGTTNGLYNIGQISESTWFYVEAANNICPPKQISLLVEYKSPLAYINFSSSSDLCTNQFVDLSLDIEPCKIEGCNTPCNCTYTVDWYQNGNYIGSSPNVTPPSLATFQYTTLPLHGSYFGKLKADCCPGESVTTYPISYRQCCVPKVMGPCFVCDSMSVTLMAQMILPPDDPCPDICTFTWFYYDLVTQTEVNLGTGNTISTTYGGSYILESDCYGCIKRDTFILNECYSKPCRRLVYIEDLFPGEVPMRFFPNPASDYITVEWLNDAPKNAHLMITDLAGRIILKMNVPESEKQVIISVTDLPTGMFFIQIQERGRMYRAAKLIVE